MKIRNYQNNVWIKILKYWNKDGFRGMKGKKKPLKEKNKST